MQVWWEDLDSQNRPILMVRLGQALNECKSRAEADRVAECIVSQVSCWSPYISPLQAYFVLHPMLAFDPAAGQALQHPHVQSLDQLT